MQEIIEYPLGSVVVVDFTTHDTNGVLTSPSSSFGTGDIRVYKEASIQQRTSAAGIVVQSTFDSIVGKHVVTFDTTNNTDPGFWTDNTNYRVELHTAKTVAGFNQSGVVVGRFKLTPLRLTSTTLLSALGLATGNLDTKFAALPAAIEAAILNEGDATALLAAIAAKVEEFLINEGDSTATLAAIAAACATAILATPANKLATNGSGEVVASNASAGPSVDDIATRLLLTPANKLATDGSGRVTATNGGGSSVVILADSSTTPTALSFEMRQEADYKNDSETGPIGPIRVETSVDVASAANLIFGARRRIGLNRFEDDVTFTGTAYYEAVDGEPSQFDLYIEIDASDVTSDIAKHGTYGWDIEAVFSDTDVRPVVSGDLTLRRSMVDH